VKRNAKNDKKACFSRKSRSTQRENAKYELSYFFDEFMRKSKFIGITCRLSVPSFSGASGVKKHLFLRSFTFSDLCGLELFRLSERVDER
jgi:hypothetical protein